ncbi:ABC transporter permease [Bacillus sp. 03113]|uniref:ABC transporter permease n=1 Tax=Bacillus sp. 03113 TaxID=2578211 RepID=UPI001142B653|nr:ABC transporter permease [Bacillus sp. 03113]
MMGILWGKYRQFVRKPAAIIISTIICMGFAYITGKASYSKIEVPVFSSLSQTEIKPLLHELSKGDSFIFKVYTEKEVKDKVAEGKADAGIDLEEKDYVLYRTGETKNLPLIKRHVERFYESKFEKESIIRMANDPLQAEVKLKQIKEQPLFNLSIQSFHNQDQFKYNPALQSLFGFTLFFSIYTVAFTVVEILRDKQNGIWDRLILSPSSKFSIYTGNLLYSFIIGFIQIAFIFTVFRFGAGIDFNGAFLKALIMLIPYLFSIVALSIFITGIVKTTSQFNAIIPLISVSFAMLGGAYWPIEIVTSKPLLWISKFVPITYGMELLKGAVITNSSMLELLYPIAILLLMGVILMGIGIRLIERR